mgnify:CR=1 FL=1
MAGHSKWSQIKRKKGANDKKRSAMYSKHIRAIQAAVRSGGSGDPAGNLSLKNAIAAAKADTVPVDNIENAIKRAVGAGEGAAEYKEQTYEGYGPGGTALHGKDFWLVASTGGGAEDDLERYRQAWAQPGALTAMLNWYRASPIDLPLPDAPSRHTTSPGFRSNDTPFRIGLSP